MLIYTTPHTPHTPVVCVLCVHLVRLGYIVDLTACVVTHSSGVYVVCVVTHSSGVYVVCVVTHSSGVYVVCVVTHSNGVYIHLTSQTNIYIMHLTSASDMRYICIHICIHIYVYTYMYTYICIHIHTYTYICRLVRYRFHLWLWVLCKRATFLWSSFANEPAKRAWLCCGYCATSQGSLDWFAVNLICSPSLPIQSDLCIVCFLGLFSKRDLDFEGAY